MVTAFQVVPDTYSETVCLAKVPSTQNDNLGLRLYVGPGPQHCRQTVELGPRQVPVSYQDSLTVYINSTKKRYVSKTFYDNRLRPLQYGETHIQRELMTEESHISSLDCKTKDTRRWYKAAVNLTPKVFTNTVDLKVEKGRFRKTEDLENEYEVTKVTGGVKVTSKDTRLEEKVKMKMANDKKIKSYKSGPFIVEVLKRDEENNNYVNGVNGNFYDDDDDDEDSYDDNGHIYSDDIYKTSHTNGWHDKPINGYGDSEGFAYV